MDILAIVVAAAAGFIFGAVWYTVLGKPWTEASGIDPESINPRDPVPYLVCVVGTIIVAAMMQHVFGTNALDLWHEGLVAGLGFGLFVISPFIAINYAFSRRSTKLTLIDSGYATGACAVMGLVLAVLA